MRNSFGLRTAQPCAPVRSEALSNGFCFPKPSGNGARAISALAATGLVIGWGFLGQPASAAEFSTGNLRGAIDTTLSHGLSIRIAKPDADSVRRTNENDGNLNFDRGIFSNTSKFTTDFSLGTDDFGFFARITGFLDTEINDRDRDRTPLSNVAKEAAGKDLELLDFYGVWGPTLGDTALDLRIGRHVLNWGESTFIQNGINVVNPVDASKLRLPGSELREGLLPVNMASVSVSPNEALTFEGFYQLDWQPTRIDPVGTYFSTTDYVGPGADKAFIELPGLALTDRGLGPETRLGIEPLAGLINADLAGQRPLDFPDRSFMAVKRGADREPGSEGQFGLAVRLLSEDLGGAEFGAYFVNYHSRLPLISARSAPVSSILEGLGAAQAVTSQGAQTLSAVTQGVTQSVMAAVQAGQLNPAAAPAVIEAQVGLQMQGIAQLMAIDRYAKGSHYYQEYPRDLPLFGLSFNSQLGTSGWALQGEYSYRPDAPLQKAERTVLEEGLRPIVTALLNARDPAALGRFLATYEPFEVDAYVERDVSQWQATLTRVFGPTLGANSLIFLTEAAVMHVHDMPDQELLPLESPATSTGDDLQDADATSFGYQLAARLDYDNAVGAVNLYPYTRFQHDIQGNSPAPSGQFIEGRRALTLGVQADYLSRWEFDLGVTFYWGEANSLKDRDFVYTSIKYSF